MRDSLASTVYKEKTGSFLFDSVCHAVLDNKHTESNFTSLYNSKHQLQLAGHCYFISIYFC